MKQLTNWRKLNPPKHYTNEDYVYEGKRAIAARRLNQAVRNGTLERANFCQICGLKGKTDGHHWYGYDWPFHVWWLCRKCNRHLHGKEFHEGKIFLPEARRIVKLSISENSIINAIWVAQNYIEGKGKMKRTPCEICGCWDYIRNMVKIPEEQCALIICEGCNNRHWRN